jgi:HSP20 family molecular chaperone IbpA
MGADTVVIENKIKEDLTQLLAALDERSRAVLWHLWWCRHAEISQLRDLIDAASDFEVLYRLKDVINKQAQKLWGKPAVRFEQSRIDPLTGEKVLFSWWFLDEENVLVSVSDKPLVDVFNEKDSVTVIAQLPTSVDVACTAIQFRNGILKVRLAKQKR